MVFFCFVFFCPLTLRNATRLPLNICDLFCIYSISRATLPSYEPLEEKQKCTEGWGIYKRGGGLQAMSGEALEDNV